MAYFGGVFSGGEVIVRAMQYRSEYQYPVRATVDVVVHWKLRGFSRFSVIDLVLTCLGQCFGN
jgi:hypothetical protein